MNKPIVFSVIVIIIVAVAGAIWYYRYGQSLEDNGIAPNEDIIVKNGGEEPVGKENQPIAGNEADGNGTGSEIKNPKAPAPTPGPGADGEPMLVNTPEGAIEAAKVKEDNPAPVAQTYSYITTCNQACTAIGYEAGYCGDWVENKDNTISQCANKQEFAFFQDYYDGMKLKAATWLGPRSPEEAEAIWTMLSSPGIGYAEIVAYNRDLVTKMVRDIQPRLKSLVYDLESRTFAFAAMAAVNKEIILVTEAQNEPAVDPNFINFIKVDSFLCLPLVAQDEILGEIVVDTA